MACFTAVALLCLCGYAAAASSRDTFVPGSSRISNPNVDSDNDFGDSDDDFGAPRITAWPDGIVPYLISSDISDADAKKLRGELDYITQRTCVQFVPRRNEANYTLFRTGDKCSAPLGVSNSPVADSSSSFGSSNGGRDSFGSNNGGRDTFGSSSGGRGSSGSSFNTNQGSGSRFNSGRFKRQGTRNGVRDFGSSGNSGRDSFGSSSNSGRDSFGSSSNSGRDSFGSSSNSGRDSFGSSSGGRDSFGSFGNSGRGSSSDSGSRFGSSGNSFRSSGPSGASQVVLGKSCFQTKRLARRLMNLLGIPHEASRPDRDQYVTINFDNIRSGYTANLKQIPASAYLPGVLDVPYDLQSVTQYADSDLSRNKNTWAIRAKSSRSGSSLGGDDFSKLDIEKINAAYRCRRGGK